MRTLLTSSRFLLVKLYLNLIQDEINEKQLIKAIEQFQNGSEAYNDAYNKTMKRIEQQGQYARKTAKIIFGWITLSTRPLSLPEIQHALAVEIGESEFDKTSIIDIEELMSICNGLVMVDAQSNSLKFIHYTTAKYFTQNLAQWFPDIHYAMTSTCLAYLSLDIFNQGPCETEEYLKDRLEKYPFYRYAAQNWGHHYKKHAGEESMTMEFLAAESKLHACSQVIFGHSRDDTTVVYKVKRTATTVCETRLQAVKIKESLKGAHLATVFGLMGLLASMLKSNLITVDIEDHVGRTPLSWAVAYGHVELFDMLLQNDANPDSANHLGLTPLFYAAVSGRIETIQRLIEEGAQVDIVDQDGRTPLFHAAAGNSRHLMPFVEDGSLVSVEVLLANGASAMQVDKSGQTPLFVAAENGRESVVKLLIERNAHHYYATSLSSGKPDPLAYAAMNAHSTTAKLLFEAGTYSASSLEGTDAPLYVTLANFLKAGSDRHYDVFEDLKEKPDPNIRDSHQRLPLHLAALNDDANLLKWLLANGADVNAKDAFGRTPIFYAIFGNSKSTALLLLDYPGTDLQGKDVFGYTPFVQSSRRSHFRDRWRLHNLLKIKRGDYDGLSYGKQLSMALSSMRTMRVWAVCDAC